MSAQRLPVDVLENDVWQLWVGQQALNARVVKARADLDFATEAIERGEIASDRRVRNLQHDARASPRVERLIDLGHAALAQARDDLVPLVEQISGREAHPAV